TAPRATARIRPPAAAPASVALFTAATSPVTNADTSPLPTLSQPTSWTFAALSIASVASRRAIKPFVSIIPNASLTLAITFSRNRKSDCVLVFALAVAALLQQLHLRGTVEVTGVSFVGIDVD